MGTRSLGLLALTAALTGTAALAAAADAPLTTPPGITLQTVVVYSGTVGVSGGVGGYTAFADAQGTLLSTYAADKAGAIACVDDCARAHPPAAPADGAQPVGDWTIVRRPDGSAQWAVRGQPVYAYQAKPGPEMATWKPVPVRPAEPMPTPNGIDVQEVPGAAGVILTTAKGAPLYTFDGDPWADGSACTGDACPRRWLPVRAPQLARPLGDFTPATRNGLTQWAWKGKPLFTFQGDTEPGEVQGTAADPRWQVILLARHFMPAGVKVGKNHFKGSILTTADGMTLYFRDRENYAQGHSLRAGSKPVSYAGKVMGAQACEGDCTRQWRPLLAPADARPTGHWDVVARADGTRQWVYKGFPLYSYAGDTAPGDMNGYDLYEYIPDDRFKVPDQGIMAHMRGAEALVWRAMTP
jgi:predicted lipoprotein with Yx(FWY)xxD motif